MQDIFCDIAIVGGTLGAVAAALGAARTGSTVCLITPSQWLGGQMSSEGVSTPDEYETVENTGSSRSYRDFRRRVRAFYRQRYGVTAQSIGSNWVNSFFAVEPRVADFILREMLTERRANLQIFPNRIALSADFIVDNPDAVQSLITQNPFTGGDPIRFIVRYLLDGTPTGELLPLCGVEHVIGAESQAETGEPNAPVAAMPYWIQSITFPFAVERRPAGENHVIPKPADYERHKAAQQYSLLEGGLRYKLFHPARNVPDKEGGLHDLLPLFEYRRLIAKDNFRNQPGYQNDVALINVGANDFSSSIYPTNNPNQDAQTRRDARLASQGYLYWLQTECPRDGEEGGGFGYPNLKLRSDIFLSDNEWEIGLAPDPYIRESRRIRAVGSVRQQDIAVRARTPGEDADRVYNAAPRARNFTDSVGIGWYDIDIHGQSGSTYIYPETRPFQIPLRAFVPVRVINVLPCSKNIGVTRIASAAYRVHPIEWHIGEAAGMMAAFALHRGTSPRAITQSETETRIFQRDLLQSGVPIFWWDDLSENNPAYAATHLLGTAGMLHGEPDTLHFRPADILTRTEADAFAAMSNMPSEQLMGRTRARASLIVAQRLGWI